MTTTIERDKKRIEETKDTSDKVVETCSKMDSWRQGDVEIIYLGSERPASLEETKVPSQLAPGTTKGSRHILVAKNVSAYKVSNPSPLEGPVLHCPEGMTVEHPEHGDITFNESGYYAITYQRAMAEELRRQAD